MSYQAITWAFNQKLPAMPKIVLIVLAHRTNNDSGECFPSINRIAEEAGMSRSSAIRQIEELEKGGYLTVIRSVKNGEKQANRYRLSIGSSVTETLPSVTEKLGGSITETLPSVREELGVVSERNEGSIRVTLKQGIEQGNLTKKTTTTTESSGSFENLIYPPSLSTEERQAASKLLANCNGKAQAILDTLSAAIQSKEIKKTPLSYLGGLVRKYQAGDFDDGAAISIADKRAKKTARETIIQNQYVEMF